MKFTTINVDARKELGITNNEYCVADSIYHLSSSIKYKENINKTYLSDFIWVTRQNILLIIKRLIEKWILEADWKRTTQLWVDTVYTNTVSVSKQHTYCIETTQWVDWNNTQYIYNNNIIETPIIPLGDEANKKENKHKTDLSFISTDELIDWRNNELPKEYNFPQFKWKKWMKGYEELNKKWLENRNKYDKEMFNNWMEQYMKEIDWRNLINSYAKHRFSLYEWIKQSNALMKFSSL